MSKLICLLCLLTNVDSSTYDLSSSIAALNRGLQSKTNIIYTESAQPLDIYERVCEALSHVPSVLLKRTDQSSLSSINDLHLPKPLLVILPKPSPVQAEAMFEQLPTEMQQSDFLIVGCDTAANWHQLLSALWQQGFPNVLLFNSTDRGGLRGQFYTSGFYPQRQLQRCSIEDYLWSRQHWFDNLGGLEVRVALYNDPPRSLVYPENDMYAGYALLLLREFLAHRGAKFVPVLTPNHSVFSPHDCLKYIHNNLSDVCGALLAYSNEVSFTASYTYLYVNILIPNAQPKSKNYYIIAPMQLKTWLSMLLYIAITCSFVSCVCRLQRGRWECGRFLLDIISSLLCVGFELRHITGWQYYILYSSIFLVGFMIANYYLAYLATILSTGVYEPEIRSFEDMVDRNISILIGDYDKKVFEIYDFPDILWNITRLVSYPFIQAHRRVFDAKYAYLAHSDRLVLFAFQQQYMTKPRMRPLPIDLQHSLPGFPMRRHWLLKHKLSEAVLNSFGSGLLDKLADDTNQQTIHIGYLNLIPSEPYEAKPLTLDYFNVPLIMLVFGLIIAFVCLIVELLWRRIHGAYTPDRCERTGVAE
ncbi:PREDICTED: uncharacterized protein LOC108615053 [Drosophila arizonae]|uniref:Uncharacterized protein LOC108615053 n=1 Tax=Drosophila arizonae TaxID=7263 RepID=A0ABM1PC38_DROAR|nr:PREDICTED: uncharacterized protein LOC108615053 [Drosophila arizonae]